MVGALAEYAFELGLIDEAEEHSSAELALARQVGDRFATLGALTRIARVAAEHGDDERAGRLLGSIEAEEARAPVGLWATYRDEQAAPVLSAAGPAFERGRGDGRRLPLDDAIDYALDASARSNSAA
jgi:hypothetical protein